MLLTKIVFQTNTVAKITKMLKNNVIVLCESFIEFQVNDNNWHTREMETKYNFQAITSFMK